MHPVVSLPVPFQGEGLVAVGALVGLLAIVDLLVDNQAHQSRVCLAAPPALVGFLSLVGSPVSLQVRRLVETSLTLRAVKHLSAHVQGAALSGSEGAELRMVPCGEGAVQDQVTGADLMQKIGFSNGIRNLIRVSFFFSEIFQLL